MIRYFHKSFFKRISVRLFNSCKNFICRHIPHKERILIKRVIIAAFSVFILYSVAYLILLFSLASKIDELLLPIAESEARILVENCINDAVLSLSDTAASQIEIIYDGSNNVSSLITDTAYTNRYRAEIANYIENKLRNNSYFPVRIPIGSLFGSPVTSGRGFMITVRALSPSYITTDIRSEFSSAGINQTCHRVTIDVSVGFTIILPLRSCSFEVSNSVCASETIIVGNVPSAVIDR